MEKRTRTINTNDLAITRLQAFVSSILGPHGLYSEELINSFRPMLLRKGDFFVRPSQSTHGVAFIDYGVFVHYRLRPNGEEIVEQFSFENEFTGDIANFYAQRPADIFIKALEKARVFYIDRAEMVVQYRHSLAANFFGRLMAEYGFSYLHDRFVSLLTDDADTRFQKLFAERPGIFLRVPQKYIAAYLGMTRETLSRIRSAHS